jgi:branched-subunit amino acid transport protein
MTAWEALLVIFGLGVVTVLTRTFFMLSEREIPMPVWLKQGLRYAPLAALMAVAVPEIIMQQGHLVHTLKDARLPAAVLATAYFLWQRSITGTIVVGTAVMMALRLGLGW